MHRSLTHSSMQHTDYAKCTVVCAVLCAGAGLPLAVQAIAHPREAVASECHL
jgi:hypothetical protein